MTRDKIREVKTCFVLIIKSFRNALVLVVFVVTDVVVVEVAWTADGVCCLITHCFLSGWSSRAWSSPDCGRSILSHYSPFLL